MVSMKTSFICQIPVDEIIQILTIIFELDTSVLVCLHSTVCLIDLILQDEQLTKFKINELFHLIPSIHVIGYDILNSLLTKYGPSSQFNSLIAVV
jgi:hypothetical protein